MRPACALLGGVPKFTKARPDKILQPILRQTYDQSIQGSEDHRHWAPPRRDAQDASATC